MGRPVLYLFLFLIVNLIMACSEPTTVSSDEIFLEPEPGVALQCERRRVAGEFLVTWKDGHYSVEKGVDKSQFLADFVAAHRSAIRFVEHNHRMDLGGVVPKRSPWAPYPAGDWGQKMVNASKVWSSGLTGKGVKVAVIDTGVDISHPQLKPRIQINEAEAQGKPGIDDDKNGFVDDINGWDFANNRPLTGDNQYHGTHVAGIVSTDHSQGEIAGIAPEATLLPLAFLSSDGSGTTMGALGAIQYAMDAGVQVINASWGGSSCSPQLEELIYQSTQKGIFFVAAAGNDGVNLDSSPSYPASYGEFGYEGLVVVGASTEFDYLAGFSNYSMKSVHLVAPGDNILSVFPRNRVEYLSGTSMATPFVSGALAVLLSHPSKPTLAKTREALLRSVYNGRFNVTSRGRLDLAAAVEYLGRR